MGKGAVTRCKRTLTSISRPMYTTKFLAQYFAYKPAKYDPFLQKWQAKKEGRSNPVSASLIEIYGTQIYNSIFKISK